MTLEVYKNSKILIDGFVNTIVKSVINNIINEIIKNSSLQYKGSETSSEDETDSSSSEDETDSSSSDQNITLLTDIETFTVFDFIVEDSLVDYIDSLDVYILSPGGVGSNHITDFLLSHNFNVRSDLLKCQDTCHYPSKLIPQKKTIYLYGDVKNAITSQYKRELLRYNTTKLQLKRDYTHETLEYFIETFPNDPLGIKKQYNNLKNTSNTAMVQYPYTVESMKEAFNKLDIDVDMGDFIVKDRVNYNITEEYYKKHRVLKQLLDIYDDIVFD